jgi:chromosome segregation ATPase
MAEQLDIDLGDNVEEKLRMLEGKVGELLTDLKNLRNENLQLQKDATKCIEAEQALETARAENASLRAQRDKQEAEILEGRGKERDVRERLRNIIAKIDELEKTAPAE